MSTCLKSVHTSDCRAACSHSRPLLHCVSSSNRIIFLSNKSEDEVARIAKQTDIVFDIVVMLGSHRAIQVKFRAPNRIQGSAPSLCALEFEITLALISPLSRLCIFPLSPLLVVILAWVVLSISFVIYAENKWGSFTITI